MYIQNVQGNIFDFFVIPQGCKVIISDAAQNVKRLKKAEPGMAVVLGTFVATAVVIVIFEKEVRACTGFFKYLLSCVFGKWEKKG